MPSFQEHPTVRTVRQTPPSANNAPSILDLDAVRKLVLAAGADDMGVVTIDRPELDDQRDDILAAFPATRTLLSFVCRMNREPVRSPARSVANLEFHSTGERINHVARQVVRQFEQQGVRALNPSMGFPMEMSRFPGKIWIVSHKPVAVAAGLGHMGIHRNVIHPRFGNFILLGTILIDREVTTQTQPIDYNPCLECKLCVAACPVGAISANGSFNFLSCYTHNYREFMGGFTDWVETIANSSTGKEYRDQTSDSETASMWQSLSFGANYKAAYCLSVCPAGEEVISPFLDDRKQFLQDLVKPLQEKVETLYVVPGSDAEAHALKRFPHKPRKHVGDVLRPTSIDGFIKALHHVFQPGQAAGLRAVYHLRFIGKQPAECTVTIANQTIEVREGLVGTCDLRVTADSRAWLAFLRKEASILWLLLTLRVRLRGNPRLLLAFGKCFP